MASAEPTPEFTRIVGALFGGNPYRDFAPVMDEPDLQGWNGVHKALDAAVTAERPRIIVDLGVWKGQSTVHLAKAQKAVREDGVTIAIDTFLGSPEHWLARGETTRASMRFRHGHPGFFDTFMSNILLTGLAGRVVPLPQTSENAAFLLRRIGVIPDLVHIDAAHEYPAVMRDIEVFWDLLAPGGLLIGDDFTWPGVARAVVHFADRIGLPFDVDYPKWIMRKPAAAPDSNGASRVDTG